MLVGWFQPVFLAIRDLLVLGEDPRPRRVKLGPQGHMGPQTGFSGSSFSMRSGSPRTAPKTGKIQFSGVLARVPQKSSKNCELRVQAAEPSKVQNVNVMKVAQRERGSDGLKYS